MSEIQFAIEIVLLLVVVFVGPRVLAKLFNRVESRLQRGDEDA